MPKPKTEYQRASDLLKIIDELDIVEFNRTTYSHFALYISDGLCVHVLGPDKNDNDKSYGTKSAEYLIKIAKGDLVRVNNGIYTADLLGVKPRPRKECIDKAFAGLTDENGELVVGKTMKVKYDLISDNNCEGYATYWKYNHKSGWSAQAQAVAMVGVGHVGYLANTTRRICETSKAGWESLYNEAPPVLKPVALVATVPAVVAVDAVRITAKATSATVNFISGAVRSVFDF